MPISIYLSSLSPDWVWMAKRSWLRVPPSNRATPNNPTPKTPTWRFDFAKYPSCQLENWKAAGTGFPFELQLQHACIHQLYDRDLCLSLRMCRVFSTPFRLLSFSFTFSSCWEHVRIYFFQLRPMNARLIRLLCCSRIHFLSARWLSASYHSRFRRTKKVTSSNNGKDCIAQ